MKITRLPEVRSLSQILPSGVDGGKEFSRIIDLLLFYSAAKKGTFVNLFSDRAGDYLGLDGFHNHSSKANKIIGYQYKFFPSPFSDSHRAEIISSLKSAAQERKKSKLGKWVLVTPDDLVESARRKDGGDVSWFENLRRSFSADFEMEHIGHRKLLALFLQTPSLCLFYYPELVPNGLGKRKTIEEIRLSYNKNLIAAYSRIEFVGMSVYKPEATRGIEMADIYIPVSVQRHGDGVEAKDAERINPLSFLRRGSRQVLLGDPGSGKSTLIKFLALAGGSERLQSRYSASIDGRLPIVVVLRKYADALRVDVNLSILSYISNSIAADFSLRGADLDYFEYYLESGNAIILFDGIDELPSPEFKKIVGSRIDAFANSYPLNCLTVTSRFVGYDKAFGLDPEIYQHYQLAPLTLDEMDQFVSDWYKVRLESQSERNIYANDLIRIFRTPEQHAIRSLAENPLLLTIVALVHRIDAVLPDERVVLYQKCTETLLNTWHTWKFRTSEANVGRGRIERANRRRIEALAASMQIQAGETGNSARAVLSEVEIIGILTEHIVRQEGVLDAGEAKDLAEDFLLFVRQRAGLIIEIGDSYYSFIHLTFQEYLTSTHLLVDMEVGGIERIWGKWEKYASDPRWHEVFRLFMADMKSDSSQAFMLDKLLLSLNGEVFETELVYLLGGFLMDGIRCAEERADEIMELLLSVFLRSSSDNIRIVSLLKLIWEQKKSIWNRSLSKKWATLAPEREILLLLAFSVGMSVDEINGIFQPAKLNSSFARVELIAFCWVTIELNFCKMMKI